MLFLVLEMADLVCAEEEIFGSRIIPKCLCSLTSFYGYVVKEDYRMIYFLPFP